MHVGAEVYHHTKYPVRVYDVPWMKIGNTMNLTMLDKSSWRKNGVNHFDLHDDWKSVSNLPLFYKMYLSIKNARLFSIKLSLCIHIWGPYIMFSQINPHYVYILSICSLKKFWYYIYSNWTSITQDYFAACCNELRDIIKRGIA